MSALRRVVFDTSSLVGAALRLGSVPHRALAQALSAGDLCASAATLAELEQVLLRPKFDRYQRALISSDADLLVMHPWQGVQIVTPATFVELART